MGFVGSMCGPDSGKMTQPDKGAPDGGGGGKDKDKDKSKGEELQGLRTAAAVGCPAPSR